MEGFLFRRSGQPLRSEPQPGICSIRENQKAAEILGEKKMKTPRDYLSEKKNWGRKEANHEATRKRQKTEESSKTENNDTVNERFTSNDNHKRPERRALID